jgi:ribonuclease D
LQLIDRPGDLELACLRWQAAPWLAMDTEFVREDTFFAKLCLVQVSDGSQACCIDVPALGANFIEAFTPLLTNPSMVKVLHSASQDLEVFAQFTGCCPQPLFDTQVAAGMLGIGDQIGYANLVDKRLGVSLDKSLTRTNWARRPLSAAELAYAADDVRYLAQIYPVLRAELELAGRLPWLEEDCERLAQAQRYQLDPANAWRRLKGIGRLKTVEQGVAMALAAWRESEAGARNRPRKWIIEDDVIYRLAERRPTRLAELAELRLLQPKTLERHGPALLAVIAARQAPGVGVPEPVAALSDDQKERTRQLLEVIRVRASELGVPPGLLAARADAEAIVRFGAAAQTPALRGWRSAAIGQRLLSA